MKANRLATVKVVGTEKGKLFEESRILKRTKASMQ